VKKGQLSMEYMFLAVIILAVSFIAFKHYKEQSVETLADATIKNAVDWNLAKAALDDPACGSVYYAGKKKNASFFTYNYSVFVSKPSCGLRVLNQTVLDDARARVFVVLGCYYDEEGPCMLYDFGLTS